MLIGIDQKLQRSWDLDTRAQEFSVTVIRLCKLIGHVLGKEIKRNLIHIC